jgi:CBS domain-containing protein
MTGASPDRAEGAARRTPQNPLFLRGGSGPQARIETMLVRDVMTYGVIGVSEDTSLTEAVETLLRSRVSAVFVFDAEHTLAGVLSEGDLLRRGELGTEKERPRWLDFLLTGGRLAEDYARDHGRRAREIMTKDVATIAEDAELTQAVDLMLRRRVKRLPVVRGDAVVGVISRSDLLKGLLAALPKPGAQRSDAEIKTAIQAELDKLTWAPRASVQVIVDKGAVTFEGAITDERLRDGLRVIAENTPGVVAVHDRLAWIEPNSGFYVPSVEEEKEEEEGTPKA